MALTRFAASAAPEVRELARAGAVALWPVGSTEQHGTHLVTGFDLASATAVCSAADAAPSRRPMVRLCSSAARPSSRRPSAMSARPLTPPLWLPIAADRQIALEKRNILCPGLALDLEQRELAAIRGEHNGPPRRQGRGTCAARSATNWRHRFRPSLDWPKSLSIPGACVLGDTPKTVMSMGSSLCRPHGRRTRSASLVQVDELDATELGMSNGRSAFQL